MDEIRSRLKPGATYIYERVGDVTYARESGAHPGDRFEIGRMVPGTKNTVFGMPIEQVGELVAIAQAAETNVTLHDALERVKMLYRLTEQPEEYTPMWHPV